MTPRSIFLLTDFGPGLYAGELRSVIHREAPRCPILDISHDVPPGDIWGGAYCLDLVLGGLPKSAIVLAVVDPGVGSSRDILIVQNKGLIFVGPDNGILTPVISGGKIYVLEPPRLGKIKRQGTFEGRDIMAPAAVALAQGKNAAYLGRPKAKVETLENLTQRPSTHGITIGYVRWIDSFGNLLTSLKSEHSPRGVVTVGRNKLKIWPTYSSAKKGEVFAHWDSHGVLEIAKREGNAAKSLRASPWLKIRFKPD